MYESIKTTRARNIEHTTSLIAKNDDFKAQLQEKGFAIAALKNELRKLTGHSVNTKFAKSSILGKPALQPRRNQSVVRQPTAFKSERPRISKQQSAVAKPHHMIAPGSSRYSSNDMVHKHYLEEAKKKTQESSRNSEPSVMPSARSQSTANGHLTYMQGFKEFSSDEQVMTSDHNSSELGIHDHSNEPSSSKLGFERMKKKCMDKRSEKKEALSSKKQDCTAMSTTEAEYVSLSVLIIMAQQQHAADVHPDELCPPNKRYDLMDANKKVDLEHVQCPPESKILTNIIKNHPLRFSIAASSSVPWIYMAQFWHTLKEDGSKYRLRFMLDKKELTLTLDDFRQIFHLPQANANNHNSFVPPPSFSNMVPFYKQVLGFTMELKTQSNFKTTGLLQPWQTLCKIFSKCLTTRVTGWDQPPLQIMQMLYCFVNNIHVDYAELLWEGLYYSLHHPTSLIPHKNKVGMKISDWMITDEMKQMEHYRMFTEVFGIDVPLTQSQPAESTHRMPRITSAPRSPNPNKEVTESSAPSRSTVIHLCLLERRSTRLTPLAPVPTVDKADEMILQDTLQVSLTEHKSREEQEARENVALVAEHLASEEVEKMVDDSSIPKNDESNILGTRIEPQSDKESPEVEIAKEKEVEISQETKDEITNIIIPVNVTDEDEEITDEVYELKRKEKGKNVEESRNSPIRSPRIHSNLTKPTRFKRYKSFFHELQGRYGYLFVHLRARFMPRKSFDTLTDNLHDVMVESLPEIIDKHVKKQVPEQERGNIQAQISTQIENAIANVIPSQVDASVRNYMSGHILHVHPAQSQTSSVPEQQYQLYLAMKADPQLQQQDIAIWLALQMKDQDNPHDDAHPEGENSAKRQKTSEYEAYVSGESSSGQVFQEEQAPSTSGNQEQDDDFDFWTDSYATDDDEIPTKQVSQDIMEEVSLTIDEAKLRKMADEMLRQRCTSGDEHQYHIDQMKNFLKSDIVWESRKEILVSPYPRKTTPLVHSCQKDPEAPALSLINQDLLYLKKGNSGPEKIVLSLHKFPAIIFNDDDIEEQTSRWVNKCVKKFNPYAQYGVEHWKNPHAKIFYIRKQKELGKPKEDIYSNSKIVQDIKTYWELGQEHKFITEIVARRANDSIVSITEPDYKNLNKNDIEDIYLLIMNGKVPDYADTRLLWSLLVFIRSSVIWERVHDFQLGIESYQQKVNLTAPTITFPGNEEHDMFSIIYEPVHGIIYKNSKKEKRVMRHTEIHKFCDATLNRVLEGLKSYNNDVKYGYVQKDLTKDETKYLKLFEEEIEERLKHRRKMRRWEIYKARLIANGSSQQIGVDCDETFSLVVNKMALLPLSGAAIFNGLVLYEFIKSSVEDLIPILRESEDTSGSDSESILPSSDDFSPIFEEISMTFSNPLFDSNDEFTSSDDESLSDEDVPEDVKIYSNPLEFDDEYISSDVNPLFDEVLEDIECEDSYDSNLDESTFLVTPLSDSNEDGFFTPRDDIKLLLHHDPSISIVSILEGFTDEPPFEENDDLFDLESKENNWKKILYDALIDDLITEDKVFDPGIYEKSFSPTFVKLTIEDRHYLPITFVIRIFLPYLTYSVDSPLLLSSGSEDTIFDPGISAFYFSSLKPVAYENPIVIFSFFCFCPKDKGIRGESS
ncbi:hypothetical protein Tco_0558349 [Tanacetum coccineum]